MRLCCIRAVVFSIKRYCQNIFSITSHSNGFPETMEKVIELNNVASATLNDLKAQVKQEHKIMKYCSNTI